MAQGLRAGSSAQGEVAQGAARVARRSNPSTGRGWESGRAQEDESKGRGKSREEGSLRGVFRKVAAGGSEDRSCPLIS